MLTSATEVEDGIALPWHSDDKYASKLLFDVISSRSALSGPGNDGQRFSHLQSIIYTDIGRERLGRGMTAFWPRIGDETDSFTRVLASILAVELHRIGGKVPAGCVGMTGRRPITAAVMRQWRLRLEEVSRDVRHSRVAVPGGVEHVSLRARMLHETGNWLVLTDFSNPFNTVRRTAVLAQVAHCVPAFTPLVPKCYGRRPVDVFFRMDSRETRMITCTSGVQQGYPMGPAMFVWHCDQG